MGKLHTMWKTAKETAKKKFDTLYKNEVKELKAKGKDDELVKTELNRLGLDKGPNLSDYLPFKGKFGPDLDKLEAMNAPRVKAEAELTAQMTLDQAIGGSGKFQAAFLVFCKKAYSMGNYNFCTTDYKKSPSAVYQEYIISKDDNELNISSDLLNKWNAAAANNFAGGAALSKATRDEIVKVITRDTLNNQFKATTEARDALEADLGFKKQEYKKLWDTVMATEKNYSKQLKTVTEKLSGLGFANAVIALRDVLKKIKNDYLKKDLAP